jgi:hypothetical protein
MEINDKLDALISLTAKDCGNDDVVMFNNLDTSKTKLDNKFYIKLRQVISKHKHSTTIILVKKCFVRIAVALMALMSLGFLTIMATPDLREAVFEAVIEWYDNYISIRYVPVEEDTCEVYITSESVTASLTEAPGDESKVIVNIVPPTKIEKVLKPTDLPEGIEEEIVLNNKTTVTIDYYIGNEYIFTYNQILFKDNNKLFDNVTVAIENIEVNGNIANIIEYDNREGKAVIWTDGYYYYYLFSSLLSIDELVDLALSVE